MDFNTCYASVCGTSKHVGTSFVLPEHLVATHRSLFDDSLQGIERTDCPAFSFQGHPEASPGPHDVQELFSLFMEMMDK